MSTRVGRGRGRGFGWLIYVVFGVLAPLLVQAEIVDTHAVKGLVSGGLWPLTGALLLVLVAARFILARGLVVGVFSTLLVGAAGGWFLVHAAGPVSVAVVVFYAVLGGVLGGVGRAHTRSGGITHRVASSGRERVSH